MLFSLLEDSLLHAIVTFREPLSSIEFSLTGTELGSWPIKRARLEKGGIHPAREMPDSFTTSQLHDFTLDIEYLILAIVVPDAHLLA